MKVVNIGSLNIDRTYRVPTFVQPGETMQVESFAERCGGKGLNQSIALARAGASVVHVGAVGADGAELVRLLAANGVETGCIETVESPTGHAVIQVTDEGENSIIICPGANGRLSTQPIDRCLDSAGADDIILLQNETSQVAHVLAAARERGLMVALNPSPLTEGLLALDLSGVGIFILNEHEAAGMVGASESEEPRALVRKLQRRYPRAAFMLTLGGRGCMWAQEDAAESFPSFGAEAIDTTGAGDTFCGYYLEAVMRHLDAASVLARASAAASIAIGRPGAAASIPMSSEVDAFLHARGYRV